MESASTCNTWGNSLESSSGFIAPRSTKERESVSRLCSASFTGMAAASGQRQKWTRARHSISHWGAIPKAGGPVEILLVENDPHDARVPPRSPGENHVSERVPVARGLRAAPALMLG